MKKLYSLIMVFPLPHSSRARQTPQSLKNQATLLRLPKPALNH